MCIIVDANRMADFYGHAADAQPVLDWLLGRDGGLVLGGALKDEHEKSTSEHRTRLWLQLKRAGRLYEPPRAEVDAETQALTGKTASNDAHVLALARLSGARLLYTDDRPLMADWKNKTLLDRPRGSIYQTAKHRPLLRHNRGCPFSKNSR